MPASVSEKVQKRRAALRAQGLRPVQVWAIDTRTPEFRAEARRQSLLLAAAEAEDHEDRAFMEAAFRDLTATMPEEKE